MRIHGGGCKGSAAGRHSFSGMNWTMAHPRFTMEKRTMRGFVKLHQLPALAEVARARSIQRRAVDEPVAAGPW